jgi:hypothetical protein
VSNEEELIVIDVLNPVLAEATRLSFWFKGNYQDNFSEFVSVEAIFSILAKI